MPHMHCTEMPAHVAAEQLWGAGSQSKSLPLNHRNAILINYLDSPCLKALKISTGRSRGGLSPASPLYCPLQLIPTYNRCHFKEMENLNSCPGGHTQKLPGSHLCHKTFSKDTAARKKESTAIKANIPRYKTAKMSGSALIKIFPGYYFPYQPGRDNSPLLHSPSAPGQATLPPLWHPCGTHSRCPGMSHLSVLSPKVCFPAAMVLPLLE